jgi:hypothetical protein
VTYDSERIRVNINHSLETFQFVAVSVSKTIPDKQKHTQVSFRLYKCKATKENVTNGENKKLIVRTRPNNFPI